MKKKMLFYIMTLVIVVGCAFGAICLPGAIAQRQDETLLNVVREQTSGEDTGGGVKFELSELERLALFGRYIMDDQISASENARPPQEGELSLVEAVERGEQEMDKLIDQNALPVFKPDWETAQASPISFLIITDVNNPAYHMTVWNIQYVILEEDSGWETVIWVMLDAVSGKVYEVEYMSPMETRFEWMDQSGVMDTEQVLEQMIEGLHNYWMLQENSGWEVDILFPTAYGREQIGEQEIVYSCQYMPESGSIMVSASDKNMYDKSVYQAPSEEQKGK